LLAAVYKSPGRAWSDADITELLSFRRKSILAGDRNDKHPFWNSAVSNPSGREILRLFDASQFEISAPQCPTHYSHAVSGDVLDIVVYQSIRVSDVIVSDIMGSDHLTIVFHILVKLKLGISRNLLKNLQYWSGFKALPQNKFLLESKLTRGVEADKAARDFTAFNASACRLSTGKVTLSDIHNDLPWLDRLLKHKQKLRKLWQETRDPACKAAVNRVTKVNQGNDPQKGT
jgi:hypothetical protein